MTSPLVTAPSPSSSVETYDPTIRLTYISMQRLIRSSPLVSAQNVCWCTKRHGNTRAISASSPSYTKRPCSSSATHRPREKSGSMTRFSQVSLAVIPSSVAQYTTRYRSKSSSTSLHACAWRWPNWRCNPDNNSPTVRREPSITTITIAVGVAGSCLETES